MKSVPGIRRWLPRLVLPVALGNVAAAERWAVELKSEIEKTLANADRP
jgi:hypothetical protein